jgi:hypothetical protein
MLAVGATVLALCPDEFGFWTSVFYGTIVMAQPTASPGWYSLQFEYEDPSYADVLEKFVATFPGT